VAIDVNRAVFIGAIYDNKEFLSAKYGWTDPAKICFSVHSLRNVKDEVSD